MNIYLETAIAVILIIVIFSIVTYVIQELIAANFEYRGKMLKKSLHLLLDTKAGQAVADAIYAHPQIKKLRDEKDKLPAYVPAANFALALIDKVGEVAPNAAGNPLYTNFKNGIGAFAGSNGDLQTLLNNYVATSKDLQELQANIEKWYNEYMDRVTGWYKKNTRFTLRIIAAAIVIAFNIDLVKITQVIHTNEQVRTPLVIAGEDMADKADYVKNLYESNVNSRLALIKESYKDTMSKATAANSADTTEIKKLIAKEQDSLLTNYTKNQAIEMKSLLAKIDVPGLPIGWDNPDWKSFKKGFLLTIIGWFLATTAISMGAPFWFDLLIKIVNIRRTGIKPKEEY